jgi:hypothetical protein
MMENRKRAIYNTVQPAGVCHRQLDRALFKFLVNTTPQLSTSWYTYVTWRNLINQGIPCTTQNNDFDYLPTRIAKQFQIFNQDKRSFEKKSSPCAGRM